MKTNSPDTKFSRRRFLAASALAVAAPTFIRASALERGGATAPSNRITMGVVGWGMQAPGNTQAFMSHADCQVVAACNIDKNHLRRALDSINGHYKNQDCKAFNDYREMMARKEIDSVMLAVPDHWHALMVVAAARAAKDIYCEKPLSLTIAQGQAMRDAVQRYGRVLQTGSQSRSKRNTRHAGELVQNSGVQQLRKHPVQPIGLFLDIFDK